MQRYTEITIEGNLVPARDALASAILRDGAIAQDRCPLDQAVNIQRLVDSAIARHAPLVLLSSGDYENIATVCQRHSLNLLTRPQELSA